MKDQFTVDKVDSNLSCEDVSQETTNHQPAYGCDERIKALEERLKRSELRYHDCQNLLMQKERLLFEITNSGSYRFAQKLSRVFERLLPGGSRRRAFVRKMMYPVLRLSEKRKKSAPVGQNQRDFEAMFRKMKDAKRIDILAIDHTVYVAKMLQNILQNAGIESNIHTHIEEYEDIPYIMICPHCFETFPETYIAFQMEQTISPRWMTERYFDILRNAYAVFDYSLVNVNYFNRDSKIASKMYYLPIDCVPNLTSADTDSEKEYDVLFYGAPYVERRQKILDTLNKHFRVKIICDSFGEELYREMVKARVVVNLHYYEDAMLETTRLYETLSIGSSVIVSERSVDRDEEKRLEGIVDFVDTGDVSGLIDRIAYWLSHEKERAEKVETNNNILRGRTSAAAFYTCRFLLANDVISFDKFYELAGDFVKAGERMCLSLPESTDRRAEFDKDNKYGFTVFPGLKHRIGWVGCGLSYKFIFKRAVDAGLEKILICEDDVYFPPDFSERFEKILKFLSERSDWDIFSGVMADVGNVRILDKAEQDGEVYACLDRVISLVFNLYRRDILAFAAEWDPNNRDVYTNAVDRYLEKRKMRVFTTSPFLVGHKEELYSTIWKKQNTIYTEQIAKSGQKIKNLIDRCDEKKDES